MVIRKEKPLKFSQFVEQGELGKHGYPRCHGFVMKGEHEPYCMNCGWQPYPRGMS